MRNRFVLLCVVGSMLGMGMGSAQALGQAPATAPAAAPASAATASTLTFDVATIKPSAPLDMAKMAKQMQAGQMPKIGPHVAGSVAEYNYMSLKDLIAAAYKVKPYQISGPDWMTSQRFDIDAKMPEGASKDDAPDMLQALLKERFKLVLHRDTKEHAVLALVVAKGGPKLKESPTAAAPIDEDAPLKPGEMKMDTQDGPARVKVNTDGSSTIDMGAKGTIMMKMNPQDKTIRLDSSTVTMQGFADTLTRVLQMGGSSSSPVVDMTGLKGNYQVSVDISLADIMASMQAQGINMPAPQGAGAGAAAGDASAFQASDPSGGSTVFASVQALGLKLEQRKAPIEQLIVDSAEKTPSEN